MDYNVYISHGKISTKIYEKKDDFSFPIGFFPFLDKDIPLAPSYGVCISELVCYACVCSVVSDFNKHNLCITDKL